jgi:hypothetical protein
MRCVGQAVLLAEGMRQRAIDRGRVFTDRSGVEAVAARRLPPRRDRRWLPDRLSTFQAEFDFGVPQFRLVFQPFLIALAAGVALVAGRCGSAAAARSPPPRSSSSCVG